MGTGMRVGRREGGSRTRLLSNKEEREKKIRGRIAIKEERKEGRGLEGGEEREKGKEEESCEKEEEK